MNDPADIFKHGAHLEYVAEKESLGGIFPVNNSCFECHPAGSPKTIENAKGCLDCHRQDMLPKGLTDQDVDLKMANSFREAMHQNCIECHTREKEKAGKEMLDNCGTCHVSLKHREITGPRMAFSGER
jgi:hypothetical protein